jgi:hypothetical protein
VVERKKGPMLRGRCAESPGNWFSGGRVLRERERSVERFSFVFSRK